ncbi:TorA-specific chaperone [Rhodobacter viridis]|uniref:TorA-specific chaperone n=1 Tax=Rhodobacter viridis TaxID=1054202 RepID=A0A318U097_9RHOB|nr:molecular chaperone TorD family protein [Rhodobacter viridis]PYF10924.1 TorA-specific chaperone [Rhodobacter viridis]
MTAISLNPAVVADRALLWHWLAEVFLTPPSAERLSALREGAGAKWLAALAAEPAFAEALTEIRAALASPLDAARLQTRLTIAFNGLFLGLGGKHTLAPNESAWTHGGRLFQAPVTEMSALLSACDLSLAQGCCEAPDHLSVELMLLAHLEAHADPRAEALQARLRLWLPGFCAAVRAEDRTGFWAGAAALLLAALDHATLIPQPEERTV